MKILKLLNKKYFSIIIIFLFHLLMSIAEDQPIDIWNIDKKAIETTSEAISSNEKKRSQLRVIFIICKLIKKKVQ